MSSAVAVVVLTEECFPDCTQKTIGAWGQVTFVSGTYLTGGIPFGLVQFADARTVDFNGFLKCEVYDETASTGGSNYSFRYIPTTDSLQIFQGGTELSAGTTVALTDNIQFHAVWNRTTVLG